MGTGDVLMQPDTSDHIFSQQNENPFYGDGVQGLQSLEDMRQPLVISSDLVICRNNFFLRQCIILTAYQGNLMYLDLINIFLFIPFFKI